MKIWNMTKATTKILLRKKGFLFFLVIVPILSMTLLNLNLNSTAHTTAYRQTVEEMKSTREQIVYNRDYSRMPVVVLDASGSALSRELLNQLVKTGIFQIYRMDASGLSESDLREDMNWHIHKNNVSAFLYLTEGFDKAIQTGKVEDGVRIYQTGVDKREDLLRTSVENRLQTMLSCGKIANGDQEKVLSLLKQSEEATPVKTVKTLGGAQSDMLTIKQQSHLDTIGYTLIFLTLGYVFLGVFISSVAIDERKNKVYSRIKMSQTSQGAYVLSKFLVSVMTVMIQTIIIGVGMQFIVRTDFGIGRMDYMILVFLMGLIFCSMTLCIGMMGNNVMNANYIAFTIWSVTCTMSGLCFPLDKANHILQKASDIMPQKWVIRVSEMLMHHNAMSYQTIILVTLAYLLMIASVGLVGMRLVRDE
jgi:ABC-2 type transport system permease protein